MRHFFLVLFLLPVLLHAEVYYWFANIQVNYLDWMHKAETKANQRDFSYFTLEGGAGWEWGEFYGNANVENPNRRYNDASPNNLRYTAFGDFDIKIANGFRFHLQDFTLEGKEFQVNDFVIGVSYKYLAKNGFWIKPFVGAHKTDSTYYHGWNGYMTGWVFDAPFSLLSQRFSLAQWNEIEFDREEKFYLGIDGTPVGDGNSWGVNGALSLWWYLHKRVTVGVQYRYAHYKLGHASYQSGIISTLKYNFR